MSDTTEDEEKRRTMMMVPPEDDDEGEDDTNNNDNDTNNNDNDPLAHLVVQGLQANIYEPLRLSETRAMFWKQQQQQPSDDNNRSIILPTPLPCRVDWKRNHDDNENDQDKEGEVIIHKGDCFISSSQLIFVAKEEDCNNNNRNWAIGATCIKLHAMAEDPEHSLYLQIDNNNDDEELSLFLQNPDDCQLLFHGLCQLVSRHPLPDDDNNDNDDFFMGQGTDDDLVVAPAGRTGAFPDNHDNDGATPEERNAMLERLDKLLVVKPELEIFQEGQFDDAEDDNDNDVDEPMNE